MIDYRDTQAQQLSLDDLLRDATLTEQAGAPDLDEVLTSPKRYGLGINDLRFLLGPIILHPGGWDTPTLLRRLVIPARLELLLDGEKELCFLAELLAYYSSASLTMPLGHDQAKIMFWLAQETLEEAGVAKSVSEVLGFSERIALSDYQRDHIMNPLRRDIRTAVVRRARDSGGMR